MASLRGRFFTSVIKKYFSINPEICKDPVAKLQRLNKNSVYGGPKGFNKRVIPLENAAIEMYECRKNQNKFLVYYLHGGAYIQNLSDLYRLRIRKYSRIARNADVALLDYRLAPEYVFPSALEDALDGWQKLIDEGYLPENILVGGDSAGGNLALAMCLKLKDSGRELPRGLMLFSPWTDMTGSGSSYETNFNLDPMFGGDSALSGDQIRAFQSFGVYAFCLDADRMSPYVSPVFGDYEGFPPSIITVGSHELLYSDSLTVYEKMKKAGVDCSLVVGEGMFHVYALFGKLIPEAEFAMKQVADFADKLFSGSL